jgi:predicted dehydrogenase
MQRPFRVGVVGHGWAASAHIPAIFATGLAEVVAVQSARPIADGELEARYGRRIRAMRTVEELLSDPSIDVVDLCSFPKDHARQAILAARAGKHLIVEKPIALTAGDVRAVEEAITAAAVRACVCFEVRWSKQFRAIRSVIDAGLVGNVHLAEVDYYHGVGPWYGQYRWSHRASEAGSSLLSAGCHALDALLYVMGEGARPVEVTALATSSKSPHFSAYDFPTTQVNLVRFDDGRIGKTTSCLDALQPYTFRAHVIGSHGAIDGDRFHSEKIAGLERSRWSELSCGVVDSGDVKDHPYEAQFRAFFESLARGEEMPLTSLAAAARTHELIFAADESARLGRSVRMAEWR